VRFGVNLRRVYRSTCAIIFSPTALFTLCFSVASSSSSSSSYSFFLFFFFFFSSSLPRTGCNLILALVRTLQVRHFLFFVTDDNLKWILTNILSSILVIQKRTSFGTLYSVFISLLKIKLYLDKVEKNWWEFIRNLYFLFCVLL
jgi:hypothetical protein